MERVEMINVLNGMCERCLVKGIISTLKDAKTLCEVFDRFYENDYINDEEYSNDVLYLYNLAVVLHESGYTSLEESYSIYNAILTADKIDFVETTKNVETIDPVVLDKSSDSKSVKNKRNKKSKVDDGIVDISDISL